MFELHRQGMRNPELLQAQAAALDVVDREVRVLEGTLDPDAVEEPATGDWTGEWEQPEEGWDETGEWAPDEEQTGEEQTGDWTAAAAQEQSWEHTEEWQPVPEADDEPAGDASSEADAPAEQAAAADEPGDHTERPA